MTSQVRGDEHVEGMLLRVRLTYQPANSLPARDHDMEWAVPSGINIRVRYGCQKPG
jgi:hypothetical protein